MLLGTSRKGSKIGLLIANQLTHESRAGIKGVAGRVSPLVRPKPFPYKEKKYGVLQGFIDKTSWRFDENSKVIVVEGPIASGKTNFAKNLAKDLDMLYLRAVTMSDLYVNSYGYDLRQLDDQLPENVQSFDERKFLENPKHRNAAIFQISMLTLKYSQYIDAICHLMNTGQGVVIERSCFADKVFVEAMYKSGFISKEARKVYYSLRFHTIPHLIKPHLVIYLDVPVAKVQDNIKKRSIQYEVKSKALSTDYLKEMERSYKEIILPEMSEHAELLVYDWSEGGDVEVVVEDIESIDFDRFEKHDKKLKDWRFFKEWDLCEERIWYTSKKEMLMTYFNVPNFDAPELVMSGDDYKSLTDLYNDAPGNRYSEGFNADMGDKNLLFKTRDPVRPSPWL